MTYDEDLADDPRVQVHFTRKLAELDPLVESFLAERVERNVAASLLVNAGTSEMADRESLFAWASGDDGRLRFFALRTPPWPLLVTELEREDAEALVERWLEEDPTVPGVSGVPAAARAVASAWEERTGGSTDCRMRDAMHALREVIEPPRWPAGELRQAREQDRALLVAWERAFVAEAGVIPGAAAEAERTIDRRLAYGAQFVWQDVQPVSTLALAPQVAGTVRIGPVYTPPEQRGRGYASAAVARASQDALARGARQCMLFTDLANPTSNKIYAAVGFRRFGDWEELEFRR
jgi:predicted GNAT family acetyltransferase